MIRGFWSARSGIIAHQDNMNLLSNNLANVNTVGYKPMRTAFKDLIYQNINRTQAVDTAMNGHGVKINKNDVLMGIGMLENTERELDVAITDENGFFMVLTPRGETRFTRAGNFNLSNFDDTWYLTTANDEFVLDRDGEPIELALDDMGMPEALDPERLGIYRFPNMYGLTLTGSNGYLQSEMSGEPELNEEPRLKVGWLERSSVDIGTEMVNVIEAQRAFSLNSRMVQVADEIEQTINSLR